MGLSNVIRMSIPSMAMALVLSSMSLVSWADQPPTDQKYYTEHLQEKLLKNYFPPRGPSNYAESEIKIKIETDSKAKLPSLVLAPLVQGKRIATADLCLRSAVENLNPLETSPKEMKLPVLFSIRFIREQNGPTIFKCVAKKL